MTEGGGDREGAQLGFWSAGRVLFPDLGDGH